MANPSISEQKPRVHFTGILLAAGLTLIFGGLAAVVAATSQAPAMMLLLSAMAFLAVGFATLRFRSSGQPLEAAIGAGGAVLVISLLQVAFSPELTAEVPMRQIVISLAVSVLFAFNLAWLGGLFGRSTRRLGSSTEAWPRHEAPERTPSRRFGAQGPTSQPAPRSG